MLITGILTQIPQSDVITGWMEHAAFLSFQDSLNVFEQSKYKALYPHNMLDRSMFEACVTDWSLSCL